ncbi:hypothetical protein BOW53_03800 [Solemya pervernicosa gill symbiont]|uniref:PAS domain S-box protein n=1 Tax=Solemya pervernicosa gill symbiont TaxID=642797 RepID=A0A1T2L8J0_9GAMM|nr:hypothetical protein BOW53_03800 [Solemya pervernicosa gill symbiont]
MLFRPVISLSSSRILIRSVVVGLLLCVFDIWVDVTLLGEGDLSQQLFAPEPVEVWVRLLLFSLSVAAGLFVQRLYRSLARADIELNSLRSDLEWRINERTIELENAMRKIEQQRYQRELLLNSTSDGIYGLDREGKTTFINQSGAAMLGYRPDELIGKHSHTQMHHSHADGREYPEKSCRMRAAVRDGETKYVSDEVLWREDGSSFSVEYTSTPIFESNQVTGAVVSFRDITERKRVEEDLRLAASAFESHEAITITDPNGVVLRVNEAFTSITGYTAEEIVGKHSRVLSSGQQSKAFYRKMWQVLLEKGVWEGEIVNRRKDGEAYPEWLGITAVKNEAGETTHYVGHFQDITERKRAASKIERQAYYDALTDLPNRRFIYDQLQKALSRCKRHGHTGALLFLDVDHFKVINDSLGH